MYSVLRTTIIDNNHHPHLRQAEAKQLVLSYKVDLGRECRQSVSRVHEFNHYAVSLSKQISPKVGAQLRVLARNWSARICHQLSVRLWTAF